MSASPHCILLDGELDLAFEMIVDFIKKHT
jgi:hypothetical protein